jgi:serine/threonine-protein kinase
MAEQGEFGRGSIVALVGEEAPVGASFTPASEKYDVEGRIGVGGMGEVLLVADRDLRRQIAMKVIRGEKADAPFHRARFVAEAQATSQLEHPGIPPVHDIGIAPDGRLCFTMKLVRGRTLADVLKELLLGTRAMKREYTLHRLVSILERVSEALHFAHEKGVIHRDLKPENVMLGDYGEVHVMDWGIAKLADTEEDAPEEPVETTGTTEALLTQVGTVKGTVPYMSPEQASGDAVDRRSDVYALGCLLYEILTLHPAFDPHGGPAVLSKVVEGDFVPVTERNPRRVVPESQREICRSAMALDPADRPATARAFESDLRAWLDGRAEAERLAEEGKAATARFWATRTEVEEAEDAAEALKGEFQSWQPVSEKRPLIEARERVESLKTEEALAFAETVKLLEAALIEEEGNATARAALADLWKGRLEDAERRGEKADTAYAVTMVERYDDGRLAAFLEGVGALEQTSDPPGAKVALSRFVERDGVLVPEDERFLGVTPLDPVTLPMGSYLCRLALRGYRDARYPVHITRNRAWTGEVKMRTDEEIGEGKARERCLAEHGEGFEERIHVFGISWDDAVAY